MTPHIWNDLIYETALHHFIIYDMTTVKWYMWMRIGTQVMYVCDMMCDITHMSVTWQQSCDTREWANQYILHVIHVWVISPMWICYGTYVNVPCRALFAHCNSHVIHVNMVYIWCTRHLRVHLHIYMRSHLIWGVPVPLVTRGTGGLPIIYEMTSYMTPHIWND